MFKPLEGETVVIKTCLKASVVYSQHDVAVYRTNIFAKTGNTYIMLCQEARTSHVAKTWEALTVDSKHYRFSRLGKMEQVK